MTLDVETLQKQIPYYLVSDPARRAFAAGLARLSSGINKGFFLSGKPDRHANAVLQGDGRTGLQIFSFETGARGEVRGLILSNSCDIDPANRRAWPSKVTFVPLLSLKSIQKRFETVGLGNDQVSERIRAIRAQDVTNMFYLPAEGPLDRESVAIFEDIHSMPSQKLHEAGQKLFTLSMAAFYLFIFKLSIHFCRMHEGVDRSAATAW